MARWFLVRHGETAWNVEGRYQGQTDVSLSEVGRCQARRAALHLGHVPFDAAYTSDLARARGTAEAILERRSVALYAMPELRERSYGEWEGLTFREIESRFPGLCQGLVREDPEFAPPGGESIRDLSYRVSGLADRLRREHPGDGNILVVGHGGLLRVMVTVLLGLPLESVWRFPMANTGVSVVAVYEQNAALELWNDRRHLEAWRAE